jgi:integrase
MASIVNRSQFLVTPRSKANADKTRKLRSRSAAELYKKELDEAGVPATIRQEEHGSWEAVVRMLDGKGKRHEGRQRFDTEDEARAWAEEEEQKILKLRKSSSPIGAAKTNFKDAVNEWYLKKGSKLAGAGVIKYNMPSVMERIGEETPLDEITVAVVRNFRDEMVSEGYAPSTIGNHRQILSGTFKYWISEKDFPGSNPCRSVTWPEPDNVKPPPTLTDSEFRELLEVISKRKQRVVPISTIVEWAGKSAMRRSEIMSLMWEDISFEDPPTIKIKKEKNDHKKKKTEAKGRDIPLWPELAEILDRVQPDPEKRHGKVFPGTLNSVSHAFAESVKNTKFAGLTFHSMRKVATGMLSKHLPNVIELSRITAHRDLSVLANVYYGTRLEDLLEKLSKTGVKKTKANQAAPQPLDALLIKVMQVAAEGGPDALSKAELLLSKVEDLRSLFDGLTVADK